MYLKALTINGFKSFAKKGELSFTTPITAIVGPNGSGKSNVAESFRFVLGEQSLKSMRGKRGEDLIFNGSESSARANRASVVIVLDNPERQGKRVFPLEYDEITIERVVHRDGENEYLVNGSRTRLKDVQELLASANIGPTGHHIISQGEADRILSASPRERREMIEDALGLKVYQFKKLESERKLKKTRENIAQVESLRREVQPHLKFLERQVKKIEKSLEIQEALRTMYVEYLKREDVYLAFHYDRLIADRHVPEQEKEAIAEALAVAKKKATQEGESAAERELITIGTELSELRTKRHEAVRRIGNIEGQASYLKRKIEEAERTEKEEAEVPISYREFKRAQESIERSVQELRTSEDVSRLRRALEDIVRVLGTLLHTAKERGVDDGRASEKEELAQVLTSKEAEEATLRAIEIEEKERETAYQELRAKIEAERGLHREAEREIFTLMNRDREVEQMLERIDRELEHIERDRHEFKRELQEAVSLIGRNASGYFEYEVKREDGTPLTREELAGEARELQERRRRELEKMKIRLEELGLGANDDVLKEYKDVKERDEFLVREITDLTESVGKLEALIAELTAELNAQFVHGIEKIDTEFSRFFTLMFGGGSAKILRVKPKVAKHEGEPEEGSLVTEDEEETEEGEEGIELDVKLPNKRVKGLEMLSGGERALTSIALIFAMSQVNPPLFVILDETDAALDEANSRRYGDMISALSERSQLILITHNRETMSRAGVLYGVTMGGDGISKLLSVKFDEAVTVAK